MTAGGTRPNTLGRLARLGLAGTLGLALTATDLAPLAGPSTAAAQERSRSIIDMLFGGPPPRRYIDPPPRQQMRKPQRQQRQKPTRDATRARRSSTAPGNAASAAVAAVPLAEKSETAETVLVVGDFLAGSLAQGLGKSVAANPDLRIVSSVNGSSGLVRDDHYDWLASIGPLIDEKKPALVLAMLGSNDRQPMRTDGGTLATRSDAWDAEYQRRAAAFAAIVKAKSVPLVWVGMPSFRFDGMSADMTALNEIYRKAATDAGGEFVDVWDGFVDANGAFAASGPDIAGQPARLRGTDGVTMTPSGSEKLAFFAEKPIFKILGTSASGTALATAAIPGSEIAGPALPPASEVADVRSTPVLTLDDPALDGGEVLLGGATGQPAASARLSPREKLVLSGTPSTGSIGRADDFDWGAKTTSVSPLPETDKVLFRGSVDLQSVITAKPRVPMGPMPSLADAIVDDWAKQAPTAPAAGAAGKTAPAGGATAPSAPVSASPFTKDQAPR